MSERLHLVRGVHQHLRRAASLIDQQDFDAAAAEIDLALDIDPESLAARALKERVASARPIPQSPSPPPAPPAPVPPDRLVPPGVDEGTWIGFEQRIEERRFPASIDRGREALRTDDAEVARTSLPEARELRPDAPDVAATAEQIVARTLVVPHAVDARGSGSRALAAVAVLAFGVALLVGLDTIRTDHRVPAGRLATEPVSPSEPPQRIDLPVVRTMEKPAAVPQPVPRPEERVGTVGVDRAIVKPPAPAQSQPALRPVALIERTRPPPGEIPDDYVAPVTPRARVAGKPAASAIAAPRAGAPTVRNVPVSTPATNPAPPAFVSAGVASAAPAAAPASSPVATPTSAARADESDVSQVLRQYARAYGQLDAGAARVVWPSVDERALARAFAGLESQNISFNDCEITVRGTTADAACRGQASYVGKIGSREMRTEPRQWQFELRRDGDAWKIESVEARRLTKF